MNVCECVLLPALLVPASVPSPFLLASSPPVSPSVEDPRQALSPQGNQVKPFGLGMWLEAQEGLQGRSVQEERGEGWGVEAGCPQELTTKQEVLSSVK